jgi:hypothetical protein
MCRGYNMKEMSSEDGLTDDFKSKGNLRGVNEALDAIKESQTGTHCLIVYPDIPSLRAIYSKYAKLQLEDNNEIVLILTYYDTPDMIRRVLSGQNSNDYRRLFPGINVEKYEKEGSLIIRDSVKANIDSFQEKREEEYEQYTNNAKKTMNLMTFLGILDKHATRQRKSGTTVLLDMGLFHHSVYDHQIRRLEKFEATIPNNYNGKNLKVFCLYHQRDFERRFNLEQQAALLDYHGRNIMLISAE